MDLKRSAGSLEDDITCSICQELFTDPVIAKCGHNFCRECVCEYWEEKMSQSCPICGADSAISELITIHTLRNIIETCKKESKKSKVQSESICSQHREELKLYCLEDQEAICVVCQTSRKHENHKFLPIKEAAQEFKEELKSSLKPLQDTHQKIAELNEKYRGNLDNIHDQADKTEKQIKEDFVKLHQFLHKEEKNLLADLKKEKEEKEQKMRVMEESIVQDLTSVSKMITDIQHKIDEEDQIFLMVYDKESQYKLHVTVPPKCLSYSQKGLFHAGTDTPLCYSEEVRTLWKPETQQQQDSLRRTLIEQKTQWK
ncbi:E3 ubiquitin-protein ligase TRIM35-like [Latimeria chalumnae]|uniref:E3 ubiquitin-protein ligase TRIM35-like n=1 Tax=Latimeria chalumnae TaxID=7897 RepID=UPI00313CFDD3